MDEKFYALSLRYLARRPRSEKEVREYLAKKGASEGTIETVLGILRKQKFVDDEEFARWWIDQRTRFKPKGKRLIALELQQKGISKEIIELVYEKDEEIISDKEKARRLIEKLKITYRNIPKPEQKRKIAAAMQRRGFDFETIFSSLKTST